VTALTKTGQRPRKAKAHAAPGKPPSPVVRKKARAYAEPVAPRLFVSSSHLVSPKSQQLSEFEFGLIISSNAFNRWVVRCMAAAGLKDLTTLDVLLLHHVNHRAREKKLADVSFMMNIEDTHVVSYSLRKLVTLKLVQTEKRGKEVVYFTTAQGQAQIERYREVREACLVAAMANEGGDNARLGEMAAMLRFLSGMYDQAARAAASL
jgi:predicted MarR family transcription regulator